MNRFRPLLPALLLLVLQAAHAQYVWTDAKGHRVYSDRPPGPEVPLDKIIKAPSNSLLMAKPDDPVAAAAESATSAPKQPTLAERNADFKKRQKEAAEKEQKSKQDAERQADIAANCRAARESKAQLDSGVRISTVNAQGEQVVIDDAERARRMAHINKVLNGCRN